MLTLGVTKQVPPTFKAMCSTM